MVGHDRGAVTPPAVRQLAERLDELGWVTELLVADSLATGDYVPGVSDLDLGALHPTWTHGSLVQRSLSGITRAELVRYGFAVLGCPPAAVLPEMTEDDVRRAARAELCGYWVHAARRPRWWLNPVIADLGLTSMARGRHALQTGQLLTKTQAIEQAHAPAWLKDQLRARRQGQPVPSSAADQTAWPGPSLAGSSLAGSKWRRSELRRRRSLPSAGQLAKKLNASADGDPGSAI
jgi:hypothetical protein